MGYALPASCRKWQRKVREFVDQQLIPWEVHAEMHDGELPPEVARRHAEQARTLRLHAMDTPRARGGLQLPMLDQVVIWEQLGRVTNALSWCFNLPQSWMFEVCSEDQIQRFIAPLLRGERRECYALTEAQSGSDIEGIHASARPQGDSYVINGEKWYVTGANHADFFILQARIQDGSGNNGGHALFFVDADSDGVELVRSPLFSHRYAAHHPIYRFHDVRVPRANLLGCEGDGMTYTHSWFRYERLMIAARCCGAAERLIDEATAFSQRRTVSGHPIYDFQAIQFMLADSVTELWAGRLMTYETAQAHDRGEDIKLLHARCAMAKLYASEMANRVADRAVQIFGGRGYMRENVAERFFRELRVDRIWEGTSEIQRLIIARSLIKRGLSSLTG